MSVQPQLFQVDEALSPRLVWMRKNKVITYRCPSDGTWLAAFGDCHKWAYASTADFFAQETAHWGESRIGTATSEDEALVDLAKCYGRKLWNEEPETRAVSSEEGAREG